MGGSILVCKTTDPIIPLPLLRSYGKEGICNYCVVLILYCSELGSGNVYIYTELDISLIEL